MKKNLDTLLQQTQDFLLRLFVDSDGSYSPSKSDHYYVCTHAGTHSRLHAE